MGGVSGHEADGAGAEEGDRLAGGEVREGEVVLADGEDVGLEGEGGFVLVAWGEFEAVEVCEGDAEVLCLGLGAGVSGGRIECWYAQKGSKGGDNVTWPLA